jgi:elongation factor Ts
MNVAEIKKLREETGLGLAECKDAISLTKDYDSALKYLQENAKPSVKPVGAGGIFTYTHHNRLMGAILELHCATDFVSRSEDFHRLGSALVMHVAAMNPPDVEHLLNSELITENKPVRDVVAIHSAKFNEPVVIARFHRYVLGAR